MFYITAAILVGIIFLVFVLIFFNRTFTYRLLVLNTISSLVISLFLIDGFMTNSLAVNIDICYIYILLNHITIQILQKKFKK